jgi:hypothetical protein
MRDFDDALAVWRHRYLAAAVTEIATLRAELFGANTGRSPARPPWARAEAPDALPTHQSDRAVSLAVLGR